MRSLSTLSVSFFAVIVVLGQHAGSASNSSATYKIADTVSKVRTHVQDFRESGAQLGWISKNRITIQTTKIQLSHTEEEIAEMESHECVALCDRDTALLKEIWSRDFTLDEPQKELLTSRNPLPFYATLYRTIERFTIINNVAYTSGIEYARMLKSNGEVAGLVERKFTHVWERKLFSWKLVQKK